MNKFFLLSGKSKKISPFALTEDVSIISHEVILNQDITILPFDFNLKKGCVKGGKLQISDDLSDLELLWIDYIPNNLAWGLISENMMTTINENLTSDDKIVWLKTNIKLNEEIRPYYIPRFTQKHDVLNMKKTSFVNETNIVIKPVFSFEKISNRSMFNVPSLFWEIPCGFYVSESLKNQLLKNKLTGFLFEEACVV